MKSIHLLILPAITILFLTSCGGGDGTSSTPSALVQGAYQGTSPNGITLTEFMLEDGALWGLYGTVSNGTFNVGGLNAGHFSSVNGTFAMSYTDFPVPGITPFVESGSGTYTASSLTGSLTENGETHIVEMSPFPSTIYNYNTPAFISSVTGIWSGKLLNDETSTLDIGSEGTLTGRSSSGCSYTGKMSPKLSGVNIFNVSLNFGASPCIIPNQTASGIALTYSPGDGSDVLFIAAATLTLTAGTSFYATR